MDRINKIINHETFKRSIKENRFYEKKRKFCKHNLSHLLDVSRIAYIMVLENNIPISKDVIYGAGLLHDIGKYLQYRDNIPHNEASSIIAPGILSDCGYKEDEIKQIINAIYNHRNLATEDKNTLEYILYKADKSARNCFLCKKSNLCDWDDSKKNKGIQI